MAIQRNYTISQKRSALFKLQDNKFNYYKTAKETGISNCTLKNWHTKYGPEVFGGDEEEEKTVLAVQAELAMEENADVRLSTRKLMDLVIRELTSRMITAPKDISTSNLVTIAKELMPYILPKFDEDGSGGKNVEEKYAAFIQNIYVQQNHEQNGSNKQNIIELTSPPTELPGGDE